MSINNMFPAIELTEGEIALLHEVLSHSVVKKYLTHLGTESAKELMTLSLSSKTDPEIARIHARVQGRLESLETLLSI